MLCLPDSLGTVAQPVRCSPSVGSWNWGAALRTRVAFQSFSAPEEQPCLQPNGSLVWSCRIYDLFPVVQTGRVFVGTIPHLNPGLLLKWLGEPELRAFSLYHMAAQPHLSLQTNLSRFFFFFFTIWKGWEDSKSSSSGSSLTIPSSIHLFPYLIINTQEEPGGSCNTSFRALSAKHTILSLANPTFHKTPHHHSAKVSAILWTVFPPVSDNKVLISVWDLTRIKLPIHISGLGCTQNSPHWYPSHSFKATSPSPGVSQTHSASRYHNLD